ncbi:GHKL domain-containing protein [Wukongibacter baidiensis]|uniref:sensor histidine kinase n=1 Tax=Wukongibacter baidiensis TaxID=1723361 RepID=UPI003D7FCE2D
MLKTLVDLTISILGVFILVFAAKEINCKEKKIKVTKYIIIIILGVILFLIKNYFPLILKITSLNILLIFAIKALLDIPYTRAILISTFIHIITILSDMILVITFIYVFKIDLGTYNNSFTIEVFRNISTFIITLGFSKMKLLKKIMSCHLDYLDNQKLSISIYGIITLIKVSAIYGIFNRVLRTNIKFILLYCFIIYAVYFIITLAYIHLNVRSIREREYNKNKQEEYENLKLYTNIIEEMLEDRKKFKHDFRNIMLSLKGFIDEGNIKGLNKFYYEEILKENNKINNKSISSLKHIKNSSLKGLLTAKFDKCLHSKLNFNIEIFEDIGVNAIEIVDACRIVGILLDNAIEAASPSSEKKIILGIYKEKNSISIIIANSFDIKPNLNKIFTKGYSQKDDDRGLGLYIVKDIIDRKYKNIFIDTSIEDNLFIQEIIILQN